MKATEVAKGSEGKGAAGAEGAHGVERAEQAMRKAASNAEEIIDASLPAISDPAEKLCVEQLRVMIRRTNQVGGGAIIPSAQSFVGSLTNLGEHSPVRSLVADAVFAAGVAAQTAIFGAALPSIERMFPDLCQLAVQIVQRSQGRESGATQTVMLRLVTYCIGCIGDIDGSLLRAAPHVAQLLDAITDSGSLRVPRYQYSSESGRGLEPPAGWCALLERIGAAKEVPAPISTSLYRVMEHAETQAGYSASAAEIVQTMPVAFQVFTPNAGGRSVAALAVGALARTSDLKQQGELLHAVCTAAERWQAAFPDIENPIEQALNPLVQALQFSPGRLRRPNVGQSAPSGETLEALLKLSLALEQLGCIRPFRSLCERVHGSGLVFEGAVFRSAPLESYPVGPLLVTAVIERLKAVQDRSSRTEQLVDACTRALTVAAHAQLEQDQHRQICAQLVALLAGRQGRTLLSGFFGGQDTVVETDRRIVEGASAFHEKVKATGVRLPQLQNLLRP